MATLVSTYAFLTEAEPQRTAVFWGVFTLRSGMLNLLLVERLLVRVVATISLSQVCWQVFSPGAEINQNSVMAAGRNFVPRAADVRKLLRVKKQDLIFSC